MWTQKRILDPVSDDISLFQGIRTMIPTEMLPDGVHKKRAEEVFRNHKILLHDQFKEVY